MICKGSHFLTKNETSAPLKRINTERKCFRAKANGQKEMNFELKEPSSME